MYNPYIVKRTQIYLEEDQVRALGRRSDARGVTSSHLIREAIQRYLTEPEDEAAELARQRAALRDAFGSLPRLPQGSAYVDEVRRTDLERGKRLEERWRSR